MANVIGLAIVGGGLWWAHKEGHIDGFINTISGGISGNTAADTAVLGGGAGLVVRDDWGTVTAAGEDSPHVQMLREHEAELSPWAHENLYWTAAMCRRENYTMNPVLIGTSGEYGVMQVMPSTAQNIYNSGYKKYEPTAANLQTLAGGIYYGTSYLQMMSERSSDLEWITRAYNGGAGWEHKGKEAQFARSLSMTADYYAGVLDNFRKIRTGD